MILLSAACLTEQSGLIFRGDDLEQISLVTATIQTSTLRTETNQLILIRLNHKRLFIVLGVDVAGIEKEVVSRNGEQWLCELLDVGKQEVLDVLRSENHGAFLFTDALHGVADILDGCTVTQKEIQLVNGSDRVTNAEELVTHIRQNIEKHGVLESAVRIKQTLHAEAQEGIISNVGVPIEILTFRTDAHRMQTEAYLLQSLFGIDVLSLGIKGFELFFADLIEVFHNWEIRRFLLAVVSRVCNAESGVKLHQKYLDGVKLLIREILVGAEKEQHRDNH